MRCMNELDTLGRRIAFARGLANLSAARLGKLANLSSAIVAMIEKGDRKDPVGSTVASIAQVLGVSTDWLLTGVGDPPTKEQVEAALANVTHAGAAE